MKPGMRTFSAAMLCMAISVFAPTAHAAIVSTTPAVVHVAAPLSVVEGVLESDTSIAAFAERQGVTLGSAVATDITGPGTYDETGDLTVGFIPAGTRVDSYFLHSDPLGADHAVTILGGSITFDTEILGIMVQNATLDGSDSPLGAVATTYPTGDATRKLELNVTGKNADILVAPNRRTIEVSLRNSTGIDQVRVVTAAAERLVKQEIRAQLAAFPMDPADKDIHHVEHAVKDLDKSLESKNWLDDRHPDPKYGKYVFDGERDAVKELIKTKSSHPTILGAIQSLVEIDRSLAQLARDEAAGGNPDELMKADEYFAEGDAKAAEGDPAKAIEYYKKAWEHSLKAVS